MLLLKTKCLTRRRSKRLESALNSAAPRMGEGWVVEGRQEPAVHELVVKKLKFLEWLSKVPPPLPLRAWPAFLGLTSAEVFALLCGGPVTARLMVGFVGVLLSADPGASSLFLCQGSSGATCEIPWLGTSSACPALYL